MCATLILELRFHGRVLVHIMPRFLFEVLSVTRLIKPRKSKYQSKRSAFFTGVALPSVEVKNNFQIYSRTAQSILVQSWQVFLLESEFVSSFLRFHLQ